MNNNDFLYNINSSTKNSPEIPVEKKVVVARRVSYPSLNATVLRKINGKIRPSQRLKFRKG